MSKAQVSIQTAISFLQQITGRTRQQNPTNQPHSKTKTQSKSKQNPSPFKHPKHFIPSPIQSPLSKPNQKYRSRMNLSEHKDQSFAFSKFNQTADVIQSTLVKFYQNDEDIYHNIQRSSQTRLNIYYRQNARILKQIRVQNQIVRSNNEGNIEQKQAKLNKQFMFTVKDDCRDHIEMCITKAQQKLSKMIEDEATFKLALVVMVDNQLKIYRDTTETKLLKVIRMYQIQHISYNEQPVKCIVVSFVKDKSKPAEHLYLKFDNNQDHDKWDRIIFINKKLYKMDIKENLFEAEYERGAKQKHFKKVGKQEKREVDVASTLKLLVEEQTKIKERSKIEQIMKQRERQRQLIQRSIKDRQYMDSNKDQSRQRSKQRQTFRQNRDRDRGDRQITFKQHSIGDNTRQIMQQRSRQQIKQIQVQHITDNMTRSLLNPTAKELFASPQVPYNRSNSNQFNNYGSFTSPQIKIDLVDTLHPNSNVNLNFNSPSYMNDDVEPSIRVIERSQIIIQQPKSIDKSMIQQSKIQKLQKQLDKGLYATKINMFKNSKKIIFLKQQSFIYYNQQQYRNWMINKKNNKKSKQQIKQPERKEIKILMIDKMDRKTDMTNAVNNVEVSRDKKKVKEMKDKLILTLSGGKKWEIEAPDLSGFADWVKLKLNQLIREEQKG